MSIKAMNWAWSVDRLRPVERLVLLALADYADEEASCFPSQDAIAERSCCSDRTVRRVLETFEGAGIVKRSRRYVGGERTSDRYVLAVGHRTDFPVEGYRTKSATSPDKNDEVTGHPCPGNHQNHQNHQVPPVVPHEQSGAEAESLGFDDWWAAYPLKKDKGTARRAFARATKKVSVEVLVAAARAYREDPNREQAFTKYPASWLNAEAWENGPLPARSGGQQGTAAERMARELTAGAQATDWGRRELSQ
ncbi:MULTISPECIES: helix-turn-helix domain-containing protein [unclassified Leucobacter]|uniref:helix-turn-helix domain-containing protein n=1 Tax=unclassified Leucobacter TaxID=2621730 RepID=UPI0006999E29|nr:helix-turn-helix domain-containing protein [Leucobacter sp. Ag1]